MCRRCLEVDRHVSNQTPLDEKVFCHLKGKVSVTVHQVQVTGKAIFSLLFKPKLPSHAHPLEIAKSALSFKSVKIYFMKAFLFQ